MEPCGLCDRTIKQAPPLIGCRARDTGFMFVLHKPDSRINGNLFDDETAYNIVLGLSRTGQEIKYLLKHCELDPDDVYLTNFFKCTLPKDRNPRVGEYRNCVKKLEEQIEEFDPKKIVFFSKAVKEHIPELERPYLVMPHPSKIWALRNQDKRKAQYEEVRTFLYSQL